jgi:hypothetical protein
LTPEINIRRLLPDVKFSFKDIISSIGMTSPLSIVAVRSAAEMFRTTPVTVM